MKRIRSLPNCPPGLNAYLSDQFNQSRSWEEFRSHKAGLSYQELINCLVELQHGLCGYCEIDLRKSDKQVEHVVPQSDPHLGVKQALDYTNMIACCKGGTQKSDDELRMLHPIKNNLSCGQAKEDKINVDFIDPRKLPSLPSVMRVNFDGQMVVDVDTCKICNIDYRKVEKTIEILGLNVERLRRAREDLWIALEEIWNSDFQNLKLMEAVAKNELLPNSCNRLPKFFTTSRSFFGTIGESILSEPPQNWI